MTRNTPATCAQVMLAVFRTHDIMAVYVAHKFENHPSVSTEYVKFLAINSGGSEKVGKLEELVVVATKKADVASSRVANLSTLITKTATSVKDFTSIQTDMKRVIDQLVAKVKELEKAQKK